MIHQDNVHTVTMTITWVYHDTPRQYVHFHHGNEHGFS